MKKVLSCLLISSLAMASFAMAKQVTLYNAPKDKAKVVATVTSLQNYVPFYQQGGWLKVGNKRTGETAWVKLQKPKIAHPTFESTFVQVRQGNSGQPQVVVYQNGKKLDQKKAKEFYKNWQQQQQKLQQQFWQEQKNISDLMLRQDQDMQLMLHNMMQTVPVLQQPAKSQKNDDKQGNRAQLSEGEDEVLVSNKQAQQKIHDRFNSTSSRILSARKAIQDLHQQQQQ